MGNAKGYKVRALITGAAGQDGSLLAELLLDRGYEVFGVVRQPRSEPYKNLCNVSDRIQLVEADLLDEDSLVDALRTARPHEVYNLAAPSFVPASWKHPVLTAQFAAVGATALLEAIRLNHPAVRFYQASSSEIFGDPLETPQTEQTPLSPLTPYGIAKAYAHFIVRSYRTTLRAARLLRDPLQPRVASAAAQLRPAEGCACSGSHQARARERSLARQPRCAP